MYFRKRLKKNGKNSPLRGHRLERKRKFEPTLATDSGINVRSQYEKRCADFLFGNKIEFQYEPLILLDGRQYRPDFFLPKYNLFLEICGFGHMPFYNVRIKHKIQIYKKHHLQAVFVHYNGRGSLEKKIKEGLENQGVEI
jgi:hypothetical protein